MAGIIDVGSAVGGILGSGGLGGILDDLFTSDEERLSKQEAMARIEQEPNLRQIDINLQEAKHRTVFVAGWRPFIGWVCGVALFWHFMLYDLLNWVRDAFAPDFPAPPALSGTEQLITIVLALLGLGGLRTYEKVKGKSS